MHKHSCLELRNDFGYLACIAESDECLFHTKGDLNKHTASVRGQENQNTVVEVLHTSRIVVVWCDLHKTGIAGLYFCSKTTGTVEN